MSAPPSFPMPELRACKHGHLTRRPVHLPCVDPACGASDVFVVARPRPAQTATYPGLFDDGPPPGVASQIERWVRSKTNEPQMHLHQHQPFTWAWRRTE